MSRVTTATWNREDRDLLIELKTTLSSVQRDVKEMKDGTSSRLTTLETNKVEKDDFIRTNVNQTAVLNSLDARTTDLEDTRIENRATIKSWLIMFGIVQFLFGVALALYLHYY